MPLRFRVLWVLVFLALMLLTKPFMGQSPPQSVCEPTSRSVAVPSCLTAEDNTPVGNRTIVFRVHGWNRGAGVMPPAPEIWNDMKAYFSQISWASQYFKFYDFKYPSNAVSAKDLGNVFAELVDQMDARDSSFAPQRAIAIAHSLGNLVTRSFMQETRAQGSHGIANGERILRLVSLAGPHHGTLVADGPYRDVIAGPLGGLLFDSFDDGLFGGMNWASYNRFDLHWDRYSRSSADHLEDDNQWLRELNLSNVYADKISVYAGTVTPATSLNQCVNASQSDQFRCLSLAMSLALGITQSDGVVPLDSALYTPPCVSCPSPLSAEVFSDYNHDQMATGKSAGDSFLFGAILGELSDFVPITDSRFNGFVSMGNPESEAFHNLRGWGPIQNLEFGSGRPQQIRGRSSVDMFVDRPGIDQQLSVNFVSGVCDDSFDLYIGDKKIFSYQHHGSDKFAGFTIGVEARYVSKRRVTITFVNKAIDDCGSAPVYVVSLSPNGHA